MFLLKLARARARALSLSLSLSLSDFFRQAKYKHTHLFSRLATIMSPARRNVGGAVSELPHKLLAMASHAVAPSCH